MRHLGFVTAIGKIFLFFAMRADAAIFNVRAKNTSIAQLLDDDTREIHESFPIPFRNMLRIPVEEIFVVSADLKVALANAGCHAHQKIFRCNAKISLERPYGVLDDADEDAPPAAMRDPYGSFYRIIKIQEEAIGSCRRKIKVGRVGNKRVNI